MVMKMRLTKEELKLLIALKNAPLGHENAYYLAGEMDKSYNSIYLKLRILETKGAIIPRKGRDGKVTYYIIPTIKDNLMELLIDVKKKETEGEIEWLAFLVRLWPLE